MLAALRPWRWPLVLLAVFVLTIAAAVVAHNAVLTALVPRIASLTTGYHVSVGALRVGTGHATILAPHVADRSGEPLFEADRIDVDYALGDLLPGRHRAFGLRAVSIDRPHVTLIRHRDGSFNFTVPAPSATSGPTQQNPTYVMTLAIKNGSVSFESELYPRIDRESVQAFNLSATLDTRHRSTYTASADYVTPARRYPIYGSASVDVVKRYAVHHWTARELPIASLVDFGVNSTAAYLSAGVVDDVNLYYRGIADTQGVFHNVIDATAMLSGGQLYLGQLDKPARDLHGMIRAYDGGLTATRIDGEAAGMPLIASGGVLATGTPQFRLGIVGHGDLSTLVSLSAQARSQPLRGPAQFALLVEGDVQQPLVFATLNSPQATYRMIPLTATHAAVALQGTQATILNAGIRYGGIALGGLAAITLERQVGLVALAHVDAPAGTLPYVSQIVPGTPLRGIATIAGQGSALETHGIIEGSSPNDTLSGVFNVDPRGVGNIGPLLVDRRDGASIYARVALDRPRSSVVAFVDATGVSLAPATAAPLPGFSTFPIPPVAGRFDVRGAGAAGPGNRLSVAGDARIAGAAVGTFTIDEAAAHFSSDAHGNIAAALSAYGPWGTIDANGGQAGDAIALAGRFRGSLARLAAVAHSPFEVSGSVDAPFALVARTNDALVQLRDAHFSGATFRGVALSGASGTIAWRGGNEFDVYGLQAHVAGGDVTARGHVGASSALALTETGIDVRSLHAAGVPLASGRIAAIGMVRGSLQHPSAQAGVTLERASYARLPVNAGIDLAYDGSRLDVDHSSALIGDARASVDGSVSGVDPKAVAPRYDLAAHIRGLDLAQTAAVLHVPLRYPAGSADADLQVGGAGSAPAVSGTLAIASGSLNGLAFSNAGAAVAASRSGVRLDDGRVTVGSSHIAFAAAAAPGSEHADLRSPAVDLADFNDYFDAGDTLAGRGWLALSVDVSPSSFATNGNVALTGVRYRRIPLGDADARWSSRNGVVGGTLAVGGDYGTIDAAGTIAVPRDQPLRDIARRSTVSLRANLVHADLREWLPVVGVQAPVVGFVDGTAQISGRYPGLTLNGNAALTDGSFARVPIDQLAVAVSATNGRGTITQAVLQIPNLSATASGTFGFGPTAPLALAVRADSPNIGALANRVAAGASSLGGTLTTTAQITGTPLDPHIADTTQVLAFRYNNFIVPSIRASVAVQRGSVTVTDGNIDLITGAVAFNGQIPLQPNSFALGSAQAPVALGISARAVPLAGFDPLLPSGTQVSGTIDGTLAVRGTMRSPLLDGRFALANGTFVAPYEASRITQAAGAVVFSGTSATVEDFRANVAGGTVDLSGSASVADLETPERALQYRFTADATNAVFNLPKYYRGKVDGSVSIAKTPSTLPAVSGSVQLSSARIPASALMTSSGANPSTSPPPFDVALGLHIAVGKDVRVQNSMIDVGATGALDVAGTLAKPTLKGRMDSTGGTISFYRNFIIERGVVQFDPSDGLVPNVNAVAITHVPSPPTDVTLHVTGPATNMHLALQSAPAYDQTTIVGLLVGAQNFGALDIANNGTNANQGSALASMTAGFIDQQFTRQLFEPLETTLGTALGLSNLSFAIDPTNGLSANASRSISKNVDVVFGEIFGYPPREMFGLRGNFPDYTAAQLIFFQQSGQQTLGVPTQTFLQSLAAQNNQSVTAIQPVSQGSGFVFTLQKRYP